MDEHHDDAEPLAIAMEQLAHAVSELGMQAMEAFKYAAAALFDAEPAIGTSALATCETGASMASDIHRRAVSLLARWAPTGDTLRHLVALQRAAAEWGRIVEHSRHIAECALMLSRVADGDLSRLAPSSARLMAGLVRQGYIALRGCLVLLSTHDRALARRIVAEDEEMHQLFEALRKLLDRSAANLPQHARTIHMVAYAANEVRQIGSRVNSICDDRLQ